MGLLRDLIRRAQLAWHSPAHWEFRPGTLDARIFRHVVIENEYRLPDRFDVNDIVLDIGGHIGCFMLAALNCGAGRVVVCEPEPANLSILRGHAHPYRPRAEVLPLAVWGGEIPAEGLRLANPLDPRNTGAGRISHAPGREVVAMDFDHLVDRVAGDGYIRLVKLDCEGAEWPILMNTRRLDRIEALCGEYHLGDFAPPGASLERLEAILTQAGFRVEVVPDPKSPYPVGLFFATR